MPKRNRSHHRDDSPIKEVVRGDLLDYLNCATSLEEEIRTSIVEDLWRSAQLIEHLHLGAFGELDPTTKTRLPSLRGRLLDRVGACVSRSLSTEELPHLGFVQKGLQGEYSAPSPAQALEGSLVFKPWNPQPGPLNVEEEFPTYVAYEHDVVRNSDALLSAMMREQKEVSSLWNRLFVTNFLFREAPSLSPEKPHVTPTQDEAIHLCNYFDARAAENLVLSRSPAFTLAFLVLNATGNFVPDQKRGIAPAGTANRLHLDRADIEQFAIALRETALKLEPTARTEVMMTGLHSTLLRFGIAAGTSGHRDAAISTLFADIFPKDFGS